MAEKRASLILELKDLATAGLERVKSTLGELKESTLALGVSFGGLSAFILKSITEFGEQEIAVTRLKTALRSTSSDAAAATERLGTLAAALSKTTGVTNTSITGFQGMLATMGFNEAAIAALTPRVLDLAKGLSVDTSTAAMALGKSLESGTVGPLRRLGLFLDESTFKNRDFAGSLEQVDSQVKGMADAFGKTAIGGIDKLKSSVGELMEKLGGGLTDVLNPAIQWASEFFDKLTTLNPEIVKVAAAATLAATAVVGIATGLGALATVAGPIMTILGTGFAVVAAAFTPMGIGILGAAAALGVLYSDFLGIKTIVLDVLHLVESLFLASSLAITGNLSQAAKVATDAFVKLKTDSVKSFDEMKEGAEKAYSKIKSIFSQPLFVEEKKEKKEDKTPPNVPGMGPYDVDEFAIKLAKLKGYQGKVEELTLAHELKTRKISETSEQGKALLLALKHKQQLAAAESFFSNMSSLQTAKNKELAAIGKVAAVSEAIMRGTLAVQQALSNPPGPPWSFALAASVGVMTAANVAKISGVEFAEGGMAMPVPGGVPGVFAEAGKPEAVIPLDDPATKAKLRDTLGGGGNITVNVGNLIADQAGLEEFARTLDKTFWRLKKNGQTVAI